MFIVISLRIYLSRVRQIEMLLEARAVQLKTSTTHHHGLQSISLLCFLTESMLTVTSTNLTAPWTPIFASFQASKHASSVGNPSLLPDAFFYRLYGPCEGSQVLRSFQTPFHLPCDTIAWVPVLHTAGTAIRADVNATPFIIF